MQINPIGADTSVAPTAQADSGFLVPAASKRSPEFVISERPTAGESASAVFGRVADRLAAEEAEDDGILYGTPGGDDLHGTPGEDEIRALGGDDVVHGRGGG